MISLWNRVLVLSGVVLASGAAFAGVGEIGVAAAAAPCRDVRVRGDYAFLACAEAGLAVAVVTNPAVPSIVHYVDTPGSAEAVDILGDYAYVADGTGGVAIIHIQNPLTAYRVGSFGVGLSSGGQPFSVHDVAVVSAGGHTYLGLAAGALFIAADVSIPGLPSLIYTNTPSGYNSVKGVAARGMEVWAACEQDGLRAYDFSIAPVSGTPVLAVQNPVSQWDDSGHGAEAVAFDAARNLAFVARGTGGFSVLSLATNVPAFLHSQPLGGFSGRVAVSGTNAYVTAGGGSLVCLSAADPANPYAWWAYASRLPGGGSASFHGMDTAGNWLFAAMGEAGFYVFPRVKPAFYAQGYANLFPTLRLWTGGSIPWRADTNDFYTAPSSLLSGSVTGANHQSWVEGRVRGPGTILYQWSQEGDGPFFTVSVDGSAPGGYASPLDWRFDLVNVGTGWHTVRWTLEEAGPAYEWETVRLDEVIWVPGGPGAVGIETASDAPGLSWATGGDSPWTGQLAINHDGTDALQSGELWADQTNWVEAGATGPGALSFWWKISSDDTTWFNNLSKDEDDMGDIGAFLVNGVPVLETVGEMNWRRERRLIPGGLHTLRWRFGRDGAGSIGANALWLDQVSFTPGLFPAIELRGVMEFLDVAVGGKKTKKMSVVNPGPGVLKVTAVQCTPGYSAFPQQFTVAPGGTQKVSVVFAPAALGVNWGRLTVKSDARAGVAEKELAGVGNGPGVLRMAASAVQIYEGYTQEIRVRRVRGDMGGVSVSYATRDGTARAGLDYKAVSGTLTWFYGDDDEKIIRVPVKTDAVTEGDETFSVVLSNPVNGARLGAPAQTTVTIRPPVK